MVFKKKWTDEQNARIMELYKNKTSADDIAKEFNTTKKIIQQRIFYLKKKDKKNKKKIKSKENIPKKESADIPQKESADTSSEISVSEVPIKKEAEEMRERYLDCEISHTSTGNEPELPKPPESQKEYENLLNETETPTQEIQEEYIEGGGMDEILIFFLDNRFKNFNKKVGKEIISPFTEEEKGQLKKGITDVIDKRMKVLSKNADLINLGILTIGLIVPRVITAMKYNKENKIIPVQQEIKTPVIEIPTINTIELEQKRAVEEYQKSQNANK